MRLILILLFCFLTGPTIGQGLNNLWMMGHGNWAPIPYGGTDIDFKTGTDDIHFKQREIEFGRTAANITNAQGNLLFATNGIYIADSTGSQMQNGDGLNPGTWSQDQAIGGMQLPQAALIIPKPGDSAIYYLFHTTFDDSWVSATKLYQTTVDMRLNGGLGGVVSKNKVVVTDSLNPSQITAVKHANGRDWWVFCHRINSNGYYRLLVTPEGVSAPFLQNIGVSKARTYGQVVFSPDGSHFAFYDAYHGLDVMNFDRCTGLFSNPVHLNVNVTDSTWDGGVAFSANSQVLYVASVYTIYQYNLAQLNWPASQQIVATYDGWYEPGFPLVMETLFFKCLLAPDGKIYVSTGNGTRWLHVINNPTGLGATCNIIQHGVELPTYNFNALPNHPNYHLGALAGSPCDSLVSATAEPIKQISAQLYPNPNSGEFSLSFAPQSEQGQLHIYDVLGKLVHQEPIPQWSQLKRVSLPHLKQGVYHSRLVWKGKTGTARFVKQ